MKIDKTKMFFKKFNTKSLIYIFSQPKAVSAMLVWAPSELDLPDKLGVLHLQKMSGSMVGITALT